MKRVAFPVLLILMINVVCTAQNITYSVVHGGENERDVNFEILGKVIQSAQGKHAHYLIRVGEFGRDGTDRPVPAARHHYLSAAFSGFLREFENFGAVFG